MNFIKDLKNKTLLICDNNLKMEILKYLEQEQILLDIKFMTMEEVISKIYFSYDINAIYYLMNKYNFKYDIALMNLKNIMFVSNKKYKSSKLNVLVELKKELEEKNLLIYDLLFKDYLKQVTVVVYGYSYLTKFQKKTLEEIEKVSPLKIISVLNNNYEHEVCPLEMIDDETSYVAYKISELLDQGVNINNIKITNVGDEYNTSLKKIFKFYKIPINLTNKTSLINTSIGKFFIDNFTNDFKDTINKLKEQFNDDDIINQIINICNKYILFDNYDLIKKMIINDLSNTYVKKEKLSSAIEIVDLKNVNKDNFVFLMNFNEGVIPKTLKDEDYITDNLKAELDLDLTYELNNYIKEETINAIKNIKNLIITYKLSDNKQTFYPSLLVQEMGLNVINDTFKDVSYSRKANEIELAKKLDKFLKYGFKDKDLTILYKNFNNKLYRSYSNKFDGIDKDLFYDYINNKLNLSYSSMNNYNECAFKYYINNILKLNSFDETFYTFLGNLFHYVLERCLLTENNVELEIKEFIKDKNLTVKEMFFLEKLTEELKLVLKILKEQKKQTKLDKYLFEEEIEVKKGTNIDVTFKGFVDKIIYDKDESVAVLVDYKTGSADIDLTYLPYGLKMQLPIYLYLVDKKFNNVSFAGFYLQKILHEEFAIGSKSLLEQKIDNLKLQGYSNSDTKILSLLDSNYDNSSLISGLKLKKDGNFYSSSKILTDEQIKKLIDLTDEQIDKCIKNIEQVDFSINPKKIGNKTSNDKSCTYCTFKDICFKKDYDYQNFNEIKDLSFLGGDIND